jgi:hypothetical protein
VVLQSENQQVISCVTKEREVVINLATLSPLAFVAGGSFIASCDGGCHYVIRIGKLLRAYPAAGLAEPLSAGAHSPVQMIERLVRSHQLGHNPLTATVLHQALLTIVDMCHASVLPHEEVRFVGATRL